VIPRPFALNANRREAPSPNMRFPNKDVIYAYPTVASDIPYMI
jgi:hypothetical protein